MVLQKAHANMGSQSVKQRDRIPEAPVEKLLGINVNELPKCEMVDPRTDSAGR